MSNEQTRAVLLRAAEILEPEGAWIQRDYAQDPEGRSVEIMDRSAICWCMEGALWKAEQEIRGCLDPEYAAPYSVVLRIIGDDDSVDLPFWNDDPNRTQAEVVQALKAAAATVPS